MNNYYLLIPTNELTIAMKNRANIKSVESLLSIVIESVEHYIIEVDKKDIKYTSIFDSYKWYECFEIKKLINNQ